MSKEPKYKVWKRKKQRKLKAKGMTVVEAARLGAKALAKLATKEKRKEWGRLGGTATLQRYGPDFYRKIQKRAVTKKQEKKSKPRKSHDGLFVRSKKRAGRKEGKSETD